MIRIKEVLCASVGLVALIQPGLAWAADWLYTPQLALQTLHNSNPYMLHEKVRSVTIHRLDLSLPLIAESTLTMLKLEPQLHVIRNPGWSDLDRNEYAIKLDGSRAMKFGNYGFRGDYTEDTTLTSELLDTGYVGVKKSRNVWSLSPYLNLELSPSSSMMMTLKYRDQRYKNAAATPLVGYEYVQMNTEITHELDSRDVVRCGVDSSRLRSGLVTSEDVGGYCLLSREMSPRLHGSLTLGGHRSTVSVDNGQSQSRNGSLAALSLDYESEGVRWGLRGKRSIEPSGYGLLVQTDQLAVTAAYEISERLSANASIASNRYVMTTSLSTFSYQIPDRNYDVLQWRVVWQWLPELTLSGGIDHGRQRYSNQSGYAASTTLFIQLAYRFENK